MSVITKDLGAVTAYAAAVNRGYTGTKEEFETLMASYATVAQQAAESAQSASSSAKGAFQAATSANTAMNNTRIAESNAQSAASGAQGYAQYAQQSAQSASRSATDAESAKQTAVDAVDGFAAGAQQALDGVNQAGNNWKSLAERQAENSEAYALGTRDGEDVGSSDPTYHNNARYYAESVGTSAQTATIKASEAQTNAEAAASSAAAAEDAADRAEAAAEQAEGAIEVDDTLSVAGRAADAKVVGDKLNNRAELDGINQITPQNLQIVDAVMSPNLINETKLTDGKYIAKNGTEGEGNYKVTDYIPVEAGEDYFFTWQYAGNRVGASLRFLACYDSNKNVISSAGSDTMITTYPITIASNVAFVRLTFSNISHYRKYQFEKGETPTSYYPYGQLISAVINRQYLPDEPIDMADIPAFHLVDGQNLINKNDADYAVGKYILRDGRLSDNDAYVTTGFIAVTPGDTLLASYLNGYGKTAFATLSMIAAYDSNKTAVVNSGVNSGSSASYTVPDGIYYVRCSIRIASYNTSDIQVTRTDGGLPKPYRPYEAPHYEILESYIPKGEPPLHVYLPSDIYVAVGRTIELYNEQVCIDHEKYHFRWVCTEGSAYARKFSITGTTAKSLNLDLYLYDDKCNICWCGRCVIHVVAASNPTKKILPIGDSLTNWKAWLQETMLLSNNNITFVGTRYSGQSVDSQGNVYSSGTIHSEGRSGWSAGNYLANTTYDFEDRYDGAETVSGSANPFWDGTKFSLKHYLTTQTGVPTPDAVQIFLGTNDLTVSVESAAENILAMVESIRGEYADLPIFVCNTIYRSNQNGYGSTGDDAYAGGAGSSAWQYGMDTKVMDLMVALRDGLKSYTGVYLIPLASCMDREYNFGVVMTKVNPRSTIEVPMPVESVHPQASGYYQMADLMYSFYCGILG